MLLADAAAAIWRRTPGSRSAIANHLLSRARSARGGGGSACRSASATSEKRAAALCHAAELDSPYAALNFWVAFVQISRAWSTYSALDGVDVVRVVAAPAPAEATIDDAASTSAVAGSFGIRIFIAPRAQANASCFATRRVTSVRPLPSAFLTFAP